MSLARRRFRHAVAAAALLPAVAAGAVPLRAAAAPPAVRLVGTYNGIPGAYTSIQAAVDAANPGDWILVGPGDYHEQADRADRDHADGVYIAKPALHLRGMNRNTVIVDGTLPTAATPCSAAPDQQDLGPVTVADPHGHGRNGIEVSGEGFTADNVSIENLTACNFLTGSEGNGNQIWWNGGDGSGQMGMSGYLGTYLTATSTYSSTTDGSLGPCCGVANPSGSYGIFSSNATHGLWQNSFASNMSDSAFYVGACQQRCDMFMDHDHGQTSALCLSSTNAGGFFVVQYTECDQNKTGLVNNSQNNDDYPSPQKGACDTAAPLTEPQAGILGTSSCTVWQYNNLHDNNNPNVPGNGVGGLAGGGPVGTGLILAGSSNVTLYQNTITNNNSWGELIVDLPDQESGPANCQGGTDVNVPMAPEVCYYRSVGNTSVDNHFAGNGSYGNPSNGDVALATLLNSPGNCFAGDTDPVNGAANTASTQPPGIEGNPLYAPAGPKGPCTQTNIGDMGVAAGEALCASQLVVPCPTLQSVVCSLAPSPCPLDPLPNLPANYPRPDENGFTLHMPDPALTPTMPDPCLGVPANAWCVTPGTALADVPYAALPALAGGGVLAAWLLAARRRRRATRV